MKEQKYFFKNEDNLKLCGILTKPNKNTKSCIILCHGITVDKEEDGIFTELAQKLAEDGFIVFRFDFRGHGESEGNSVDMTVRGEGRDLEAAYKFLINKGYNRFGIVAASFAGGAASFFTPKHQDKVRALVLWNSVINYTSFYKRWLANGGREKLKRQRFIIRNNFKVGEQLFDETFKLKPWKELKKLSIPILFIHGDRDSKVPYADSVKYSKMLNAKLITIHGADHGFHDNKKQSEQADKATSEFFEEQFLPHNPREMIAVVDENDNIIAKAPRRNHANGKLHREASVLIVNQKNEILLQRRADSLKLDYSASGHFSYDEDYLDGITREVKEELGLSINKAKFKKVAKFKLDTKEHDGTNNYRFITLFEVKGDYKIEDLYIDSAEVKSIKFYNISELKKLIETAPEEMHQGLVESLKIYFGKKV